MATPKYKKSRSGYYKVDLASRFDWMDHPYLPGADHTVDQDLLDRMIEAGVVTSVVAAD